MCGIVGYVGPKPVVKVIIEGLRKLEYRGYDSAGLAVVRNRQVLIRRTSGKLGNLVRSLESEPLSGDYGIGHTRWATHGRPTEANAHPHKDCTGKILIVHNGIVENYLELKSRLQNSNHRFFTETDTEVVAHLVESMMPGRSFPEAAAAALKQLRGSFAVCLISADSPGTRSAKRCPVHLAFAPPFDMENFPGSDHNDKIIRRQNRADAIWAIVNRNYENLSAL